MDIGDFSSEDLEAFKQWKAQQEEGPREPPAAKPPRPGELLDAWAELNDEIAAREQEVTDLRERADQLAFLLEKHGISVGPVPVSVPVVASPRPSSRSFVRKGNIGPRERAQASEQRSGPPPYEPTADDEWEAAQVVSAADMDRTYSELVSRVSVQPVPLSDEEAGRLPGADQQVVKRARNDAKLVGAEVEGGFAQMVGQNIVAIQQANAGRKL